MTTPDPGSPARETSVDLPLCLAAVDDHPYVLKGILWTLRELAPWITVITTAATVTELLGNGGAAADVVLLDLDLGVGQADEESDPTRNVRTILAAGPQVLILTAEVRPVPVRRAIAAGAVGLVLKSDPESQLIQAIRTARTGEFAVSSRLAHALLTDPTLVGHLAPREQQVFELLAQGVGRHDIGKLLDPPAATSTVDTYLKRAANTFRSLGRPTYNAKPCSTSSRTDTSTARAENRAASAALECACQAPGVAAISLNQRQSMTGPTMSGSAPRSRKTTWAPCSGICSTPTPCRKTPNTAPTMDLVVSDRRHRHPGRADVLRPCRAAR